MVGLAPTKSTRGTPDLQSGAFAAQPHMHLETDEGRKKQSREHTSRHNSPEMANSRTLAKHRVHHPSKAPCLHPAKSISIVKKQKERAFSFSGKLPAPSILLNLFEIGSGRPLPLYYCLILTNRFMAADCCRRIDCSLYVLLVNIEVSRIARTALYKVSIVTLSRIF